MSEFFTVFKKAARGTLASHDEMAGPFRDNVDHPRG